MYNVRGFLMCFAFLLVACGGGGRGLMPAPSATRSAQLVATQFTIGSSAGHPSYVTANVQSVVVVLDSVNGGAPPAGVATSATDSVVGSSCPCTIAGPTVPAGTDVFTITTYDGATGSGHAISTNSPSIVITASQTSSNVVPLEGIPASLAISDVPSGAADTGFVATPFTVTVRDADANTITGAYARAVSLSDSDTTGATTISTTGTDNPPAAKLLSSSDSAKLTYTGLAIINATLTASATGATNGTGTFAPTLNPIVYTGPENGGLPEIDLYATSGAGSSGTFTAREAGWTDAPYLKSITQSEAAGCRSIATTSPASGTSFTTSVASAPSPGICTLTLSDFTGGQTTSVTLTYTASILGVESKPRHH
ncbi:MAG TPA: hypothetical protein VMG98_01260 [Verrucomicrobiae bacterium]|nr:hypothetical protein [Verrucomicrobiae bacterium]